MRIESANSMLRSGFFCGSSGKALPPDPAKRPVGSKLSSAQCARVSPTSMMRNRPNVRQTGRLAPLHEPMADATRRRCQAGVEAVPTGFEGAASGYCGFTASEMTSVASSVASVVNSLIAAPQLFMTSASAAAMS